MKRKRSNNRLDRLRKKNTKCVRIELTLHEGFSKATWIGSKYRPARVNLLHVNDVSNPHFLNAFFDVAIIDVVDFNREAVVVRKDVLFGILPFVYKTKLKLSYFAAKRKARTLLRLQSWGWAYTQEGCWHSWGDIGRKPSPKDKQLAKDIIKMWKQRP